MSAIDLAAQVEAALATKGGRAAIASALVDHCDDYPWASPAYMVENVDCAARLMAEQLQWASQHNYRPHLTRFAWFPELLVQINQGTRGRLARTLSPSEAARYAPLIVHEHERLAHNLY